MKRYIVFILMGLLLLSGCAAKTPPVQEPTVPDGISAATMERYRDGEWMEYNGEKLDPAVGPRDNSIKGIQQVDIATYSLTVDGLADAPQTYTYNDVLAMPSEERLIRDRKSTRLNSSHT